MTEDGGRKAETFNIQHSTLKAKGETIVVQNMGNTFSHDIVPAKSGLTKEPRNVKFGCWDYFQMGKSKPNSQSLSKNSDGCCFRTEGWLARRDEEVYPSRVFDRGVTPPDGLLHENPAGGGSFVRGQRWLGLYSPLRGCSGLAAWPTAKIPRRSTPRNFQTDSRAFTLVEVMIVVGIIALLASMAFPYYVMPRATAQANACINNLVKIEEAAAQFALERGQKTGDPFNYPSDLTPYLKLSNTGEIPACPARGTYSVGYVGSRIEAVCSLGSIVTPAHLVP